MALSRCLKCGTRKPDKYSAYVFPISYPENSALICGLCNNSGVIWLTEEEQEAYRSGQRIFGGDTNVAKFKADEQGINNLIK